MAEKVLGQDISKDLQASDWAAPNQSDAQFAYAAADPAMAYIAGRSAAGG